MTLTTPPPTLLPTEPTMSTLDIPKQDDNSLMQLDTNIQVSSLADNDDEFSDFAEDPEELEIIERLLEEAAQQTPGQNASLVVTDIEDYEPPQGVFLPKVFGHEATRSGWEYHFNTQRPDSNSRLGQVIRDEIAEQKIKKSDDDNGQNERRESNAGQDEKSTKPDLRPPIERFRRPPKKALSVTDLVSPSWCELQYFYVLSKHGRKRRTPAMKQGSAVHQALEDEVHVTVPVVITKKEDSWGLRIWNIIQGLRTLRETGRTREFEVWGSIGGEIVNGVIDELSYECPDPKLEDQSLKILGKQENEPVVPEYQASIRDYLMSSEHSAQGQSLADALKTNADQKEDSVSASKHGVLKREKRIYLTDVKTRGISTMPTGSSIRPTIVQLHLYHHMLENMAQGSFPLQHLSDRYHLDVNETFSDGFIAQVGGLNQQVFDIATSQHENNENGNTLPSSTQDSIDILLQHSNLSSLWTFMMDQFRETFIVSFPKSSASVAPTQSTTDLPPPSSQQSLESALPTPSPLPTRLSPLITAHYVSSSSGAKFIGSKSIIFNPSFLRSYLYDALAFWRGQRDPKGVLMSEAWKCRICEFRDECDWIKGRDDRAVRESMEKRESSRSHV